jgi:hyperosmotically inducible periplasmic protein
MSLSKTKWIALMILLVLSVGINGCATLATEAAKKAWEDRSTADQVADAKMITRMLDHLFGIDKGLLLDVGVDVWEGRMLLTGALDDAKVRGDILDFAKQDSRLKRLYNKIQIVTPEEKGKRRKEIEEGKEEDEGGTVSNFWIETKISVQLLKAKTVTSVNYRWRSVDKVVYVLGRAKNDLEKNYVIEIISKTEGVKSVKEFIEVK